MKLEWKELKEFKGYWTATCLGAAARVQRDPADDQWWWRYGNSAYTFIAGTNRYPTAEEAMEAAEEGIRAFGQAIIDAVK